MYRYTIRPEGAEILTKNRVYKNGKISVSQISLLNSYFDVAGFFWKELGGSSFHINHLFTEDPIGVPVSEFVEDFGTRKPKLPGPLDFYWNILNKVCEFVFELEMTVLSEDGSFLFKVEFGFDEYMYIYIESNELEPLLRSKFQYSLVGKVYEVNLDET